VRQTVMSVDLSKIEQSKSRMRARLRALPFAEKLRILDRLRERTLALRGNSLRRKRTSSEDDVRQ
jgi:hypothetical protein